MVDGANSSGFLIDGFPRETKQGKQFERQVSPEYYKAINIIK